MKYFLINLLLLFSFSCFAQKTDLYLAQEAHENRRKALVKLRINTQKKADRGNVDSMLVLAKAYLNPPKDFPEWESRYLAKWYLEKGCEKKNGECAFLLGQMYAFPVFNLDEHGFREDANYDKAIDYLSKGADWGNADAMFALLNVMKKKYNSLKDTATINKIYNHIKDKRDQVSPQMDKLLKLASDRPFHKGLDAYNAGNYDSAFTYWKASMLVNYYEEAAYNIGILYYDGKGVRQDYTKAAIWFAEASDLGSALGSYMAGDLWTKYAAGSNGYKYWFERALKQGYPDEDLVKQRIEKHKKDVEIAYGGARAREIEASKERYERDNKPYYPNYNKPNNNTYSPPKQAYTGTTAEQEASEKRQNEANQRDTYYKEKWGN